MQKPDRKQPTNQAKTKNVPLILKLHKRTAFQHRANSLQPTPPQTRHRIKQQNLLFCCQTAILEQYECDSCRYQTDLKLAFDRHQCQHQGLIETGFKRYICNKCTFQTYSLLILMRHACRATPKPFSNRKGEKWFECDQCTYRTRWKKNIREHRLYNINKPIHNDKPRERSFACTKCPFMTPWDSSLKKHLQNVHDSQKLRYQCEHCLKKFKNQHYLCDHRRRQHEQEWFKCEKCGFKTGYGCKYRAHMQQKHQESGLFDCKECPLRARSLKILEKHILRKHSREALVCQKCDKTLKTMTSLRNHYRLVHQEDDGKFLRCGKCSFKTVYRQSFRNHVNMMHDEGEKWREDSNGAGKDGGQVRWFRCPHCAYRTCSKHSLRNHVDRVHNGVDSEAEKKFGCVFCSYKAKYEKDLDYHVWSRHGKTIKRTIQLD